MNNNFEYYRNAIPEMLKCIPVEQLDYDTWCKVGMALHHEGYPMNYWIDWSSKDSVKCKETDFPQKWNSFKKDSGGISGAYITNLAKTYGWKPNFKGNNYTLSTKPNNIYEAPKNIEEHIIEIHISDNLEKIEEPKIWNQGEDLITFLETLYKPDDIVAYCIDAKKGKDNKWNPQSKKFQKCSELVEKLKSGFSVEQTLGKLNKESGAWVQINPSDGEGGKAENVVGFRYSLIECDDTPIEEQVEIYKQMNLPIATLSHSGNKSVHAIVKIDASNIEEYTERVKYLFNTLQANRIEIDTANKNCNRLTRIPSVVRGNQKQFLITTNMGCKDWDEWIQWLEDNEVIEDGLPPIVPLSDCLNNLPELEPELIHGILRKGHKMLISGASKGGKSFLLMELAIALAEGRKWLYWDCTQCKVLYINLEIDGASFENRIAEIYSQLGIDKEKAHSENIYLWNLRGKSKELEQLVEAIVKRARRIKGLGAIIVDPIYKVMMGDENNASDMGKFCNQFDKIATQLGCSIIYVHHHSKGAQGNKSAMDRASGSGVFSRDADALLDMIELIVDDSIKTAKFGDNLDKDELDNISGFRIEPTLREFPSFSPKEIWWKYPIHDVDYEGLLRTCKVPTFQNMGLQSMNDSKKAQRQSNIEKTLAIIQKMEKENRGSGKPLKLKEVVKEVEVSEKTLRSYLDEDDKYSIEKGIIYSNNLDSDDE